jgi:ABC-type lipoprotein release transport system permease subunit
MSSSSRAEQAPAQTMSGRRVRRPLAPTTFLFRNAAKTMPLIGVILLAVMLVCGIVAMMNSIPYSIRSTYSYSKNFVAVTPRGDATMPPVYAKRILENSPVPVGRVMFCRASGTQVNSIVGKWQFVNLGLRPDDAKYYLERMNAKLAQGRMPEKGAAECIITEPVARNLRLKVGSILQRPDDQDSYSPQPVKVVGIAQSENWLIVGDYEYQNANHFPPIDGVLAFAKDPAQQEQLDTWAIEAFKGERAAVLAYQLVNRDTDNMFDTLYKILNVVIATLVIVITIMMGMLINIYQSQRLVEFGLLQALGYTKRQLLSRVLRETVMVVVFGWALGIATSYWLLVLVDNMLMKPNAFAFRTWDMGAFTYTLPVPVAIMIVATLTIVLRFRKFDPVGIVERRLV